MKRFFLNILLFFLISCFTSFADETSKETEFNFFTGMFDFSDDKQKSGILGIQHQNENLFRNSFLGRLSPITGAFLTEKTVGNKTNPQKTKKEKCKIHMESITLFTLFIVHIK